MNQHQEEIQKVFIESTRTVFTAITGFSVEHLSTSIKKNYQIKKELIGILDISGTLNGLIFIGMTKSLTRKISQKVTDLTKKQLTDEIVHDTAGEIINQVAGVAQQKCADINCKFSIGIPKVSVGLIEGAIKQDNSPFLVIRFNIDGEEIELVLAISLPGKDKISSNAKPTKDFTSVSPSLENEEELLIEEGLQEIVNGFIIESEEFLDELDQVLVSLDNDQNNLDFVGQIFRTLHTLKGNSRALGFEMMETMVHRTEDVVRKVHDGEMQITSEMMDVIFEAVDLIKALLQDVKDRKKRPRNLDRTINKLKLALGDTVKEAPEEDLIIAEDLQEIVDGFVIESKEYLEQLDQDLVDLDSSHDDMELVGKVFRNLHTLKGNSRALGFQDMETIVHCTEDVVRKVQDGETQVTSEMMDVIFEAVDLVKTLLQDVKDRKKRSHDLNQAVDKLKQVLSGTVGEAPEEDLIIEEDLQEIVDGFVIESEEYIEQLDQDLVSLDASHEDMELVGKVFRNLHTLKGNSRALGFEEMETIVHRTEDVVRKVQGGELKVNSEMMDIILESVDFIKTLLQDIKERKKRPRNLDNLISKLDHVITGDKEQNGEEKLEIEEDLKEIVDGFVMESEELLSQLDQDLISLEKSPEDADLINKVFRALHTLKGNSQSLGFTSLEELDHRTEDVFRKIRDGKMKVRSELMDVVLRSVDIIKLLLADIKMGIVSKINLSDINSELNLVLEEKYNELREKREKAKSTAPAKTDVKKPSATTIRVDINKLDKLIDVTGELVLHKNRLLNFAQKMEQGLPVENVDEFLNEINAQMGFLVSDLQSGVMSTRMQPIGKVFSKYPRVVRDLARETGKEIDLIITGQETELDNTIVEEIGDPLIHMVRNSCDHGVETPDIREANGKDRKGTVELMAYYEGNFVVIEIRDDGKGIDQDVIRQKGIDKGLITEDQAKTMAKGDVFNLIFMPGFSTAEKVTAVSGRGVGMDVVKTSIAKLNGIIEMDSELGKGTTVKIKLPLTLAVMLGLEIEVGHEKYLLPQETVIEIITVPKKAFQKAKKEKKFLFRRKHTLPLVDLKETLMQKANGSRNDEEGYIIVIGEVEKRTGVLVDNVIQQQEVVIKPLGKYVNNFRLKEINGATIMGDGSIELIINHNHLMAAAQEVGS